MLVLVILVASAAAEVRAANQEPQSKTVRLVEKIRRQLMEDNYDYLPSEGEIVTPAHRPLGDRPNDILTERHDPHNPLDNRNDPYVNKHGDRNGNHGSYEIKGNDGRNFANNDYRDKHYEAANVNRANVKAGAKDKSYFYDYDDNNVVPRATQSKSLEDPEHSIEKEVDGKKKANRHRGHVVAQKDLLYYVDDERLRPRSDAPPTSKYKVIKVKNSEPSRRSESSRRIIQEEWSGGVALVSLDGRPLPGFRLPRARRQYMTELESGPELDAPQDLPVSL